MEWIKCGDRPEWVLPKDRPFLALWKGAFCISEFDEERDQWCICFLPAQEAGIIYVSHDRIAKFTHYCELKLPEDY